jgi:cardiolipin synthase
MTIPNLITSIRIILVPIFIIYLLRDELTAALIVFILAGLSDGVDGFVARMFNQKSRLGAFLDPLADKMLLVAAFVVLAARDYLPPWLTVVVISRDFFILLGVLILVLTHTDITIKPSVISKVTTCLQLMTIFLVLSKTYVPQISQITKYLFWATGLLTISSGLDYMRYWFRMMAEGTLSD